LNHMKKKIQSSILNFMIFPQVERVQNRALFEQYSARKECMENQTQGSSVPVERELWHTVDTESTPLINSDGFNRNFCSRKCKTNTQRYDTVFIRPSSDGTYYVMALSVRRPVSVRVCLSHNS
jgi:hypothetical protein